MKPKLPPIPKDSSLVHFLNLMKVTEVPTSYAIVIGLSTIGAVLKRYVYVDQLLWKVYPCIRVLLIGPSGIGKDTTIDEAEKVLKKVKAKLPIVGGRTYENMLREVASKTPPHIVYVPIYELTSFLGKKDYQSGAMEGLTNILSDKDRLNISIKSDKEPVWLLQPTFTIHAGSTKEWLQKQTPEGALEGGFFPRFVVVVEEYTGKFRPLIKHATTNKERQDAEDGMRYFVDYLNGLVEKYAGYSIEIHMTKEAQDTYTNWYYNRHSYFPPTVRAYAERSRDQVLRFAMVMALSRGRSWIDESDVQWAAQLMHYLGQRIDEAMLPGTIESKCSQDILKLLPRTKGELLIDLNKTYSRRTIEDALRILEECGRVSREGKDYRLNDT